MKNMKKLISAALVAAVCVSCTACAKSPDMSDVFKDNEKISYSTSYTQLSDKKTNKKKSWRQGMVGGNGLEGFITSGSPYSDTIIYQNMHFIMPNENARTCPDTADELETVKQSIVKGEDIVDNASYDDVYRFHPGGQLRISSQKHRTKDYVRYTDYETAQVGVRYTDKNGTWERTTFTSLADCVTVTKIERSSENTPVTVTLGYDDISTLANYSKSDEVNIRYKKTADGDKGYLAFVAHYPDYENSELKNGGYATLTYIVTDGGTLDFSEKAKPSDAQYASDSQPQVTVSGADSVYLITVTGRDYNMGKYSDFDAQTDYSLVNSLYKRAADFAKKYTADGKFSYDSALNAHLAKYKPQFDAVTLTLKDGSSDKSNESLLRSQRFKKKLNSDLSQRSYYAGRYAYLCCSGYSTSRLYGMWTGEWNTGWGSKYTMDANVNLQTSSMNTGNISSSPIGYTYFILRQLPDWEENALATHGFTDAIQAPVNTDGDKAVITETCYPYPFRYWNAGSSWMIQPLYETLQCYGNIRIPLSDEIDLEKLKSVLSTTADDLTDSDIETIKARGYLQLEEDVLMPLLIKSVNYWEQLMTAEYYTDSNGDIHYEAGKTELADNEYYCILPSYSPENNPSNYPSPSDANTAIDIAACRDNINMLLSVVKDVAPETDTARWEYMLKKLPPYLYDETGALKEWACNQFSENNKHRHLSHLYCVWPLFETQNDEQLKQACIQAIDNRTSENEASHALVHRSLIAARLKDRTSITSALLKLQNHKIRYNSLMTNHDYDQGSCYCTDFAIGYLGIVNEALVYSNTNEIEVLPALFESGFDAGEITGIKARTRATVDSLKWDVNAKTAQVTVTSDIEQTIKLSCGLSDKTETLTFAPGETKTVEFTLN